MPPALGSGALFADLNTAAPARQASRRGGGEQASGAAFADVALLGAGARAGRAHARRSCRVRGPSASRTRFGALGMPVTPVGAEVGDASARKLARSVFAKGLAAAVGESLEAARALGCEDWLYADIESTLTAADAALLRRLVEGSRAHAGRRVDEMAAAVALLEELGVEPRVASATERGCARSTAARWAR